MTSVIPILLLYQDGDLLDSGRLVYAVGDGWRGHEAGAPYDAIHVGAAASSIPKELLSQLKVKIKHCF